MRGDRTLYEVLGVSPEATGVEIKSAYRRLLLQTHPDQGGSSALLDLVREAYEVLGDEQRRRVYDSSIGRASTPPPTSSSNGTPPNDAPAGEPPSHTGDRAAPARRPRQRPSALAVLLSRGLLGLAAAYAVDRLGGRRSGTTDALVVISVAAVGAVAVRLGHRRSERMAARAALVTGLAVAGCCVVFAALAFVAHRAAADRVASASAADQNLEIVGDLPQDLETVARNEASRLCSPVAGAEPDLIALFADGDLGDHQRESIVEIRCPFAGLGSGPTHILVFVAAKPQPRLAFTLENQVLGGMKGTTLVTDSYASPPGSDCAASRTTTYWSWRSERLVALRHYTENFGSGSPDPNAEC